VCLADDNQRFFNTATFRNVLGSKDLSSLEISNKRKSYVENKSDLLFIGTCLRF